MALASAFFILIGRGLSINTIALSKQNTAWKHVKFSGVWRTRLASLDWCESGMHHFTFQKNNIAIARNKPYFIDSN